MGSASGVMEWEPGQKGKLFKFSSSGSHVDPQSAKPGSLPSSEPTSFTGVVAGTKGCLTLRWNGRVDRGGGMDDQVVVPAGPGRVTHVLPEVRKYGGETDLIRTVSETGSGACESDLKDEVSEFCISGVGLARGRVLAEGVRSSESELEGAMSEGTGRLGLRAGVSRAEKAAESSVLSQWKRCSRGAAGRKPLRAEVVGSVDAAFLGRRAARRARKARGERAETGSDSAVDVRSCDSRVMIRVESLCARVARVNAALDSNLCRTHSARSFAHNSHARSLHDVHDACGYVIHDVNSVNSGRDGVARGPGVCRDGGTKPRSTRTRDRVIRPLEGPSPVVDKLASDHRGESEEVHVEAREGRTSTTRCGTKLVELRQGCEVLVKIPSDPERDLMSPGPGSSLRERW